MKQDKILKERLKKKYDAGFTTNVESITLPHGLNEGSVSYTHLTLPTKA